MKEAIKKGLSKIFPLCDIVFYTAYGNEKCVMVKQNGNVIFDRTETEAMEYIINELIK